eukprot:3354183-Amphidinium_carterae.1
MESSSRQFWSPALVNFPGFPKPFEHDDSTRYVCISTLSVTWFASRRKQKPLLCQSRKIRHSTESELELQDGQLFRAALPRLEASQVFCGEILDAPACSKEGSGEKLCLSATKVFQPSFAACAQQRRYVERGRDPWILVCPVKQGGVKMKTFKRERLNTELRARVLTVQERDSRNWHCVIDSVTVDVLTDLD